MRQRDIDRKIHKVIKKRHREIHRDRETETKRKRGGDREADTVRQIYRLREINRDIAL